MQVEKVPGETAKRMAPLKIAGGIVFRLAPSAIQHCLLGGLGGADPTGPT